MVVPPVALAGVRWLVDGNNLLGTRPDGWWKDRAGAARRLVSRLACRPWGSDETFIVVFDGPQDDGTLAIGAEAGIQVRFAPGGPDAADDEIARLVSADEVSDLTVVTSDRVLSQRVRWSGAAVMGAGTFRRMIERDG